MSSLSTMQWLRAAVQRVAVGSGRRATYLATWTVHRARRIWGRARGWLDEGTGFGWLLRAGLLILAAAILRKIVTAIGTSIYHRVEDGGAPVLSWGAAAWWIVSAYRAGADDWKPKRPAAPAVDAPAEEQPAAPDEPVEAAAQPSGPRPVSPVELVATVRDIGTPHAQLVPIAEYLQVSTDAVRAAAAAIGWPVKDVRMDGRSSSAGLRWDECPSPKTTDPLSGDVGAGQRADDNDDDSDGEGPQEGLRVEDIGQSGRLWRHPADRVRHHTVREKRAS